MTSYITTYGLDGYFKLTNFSVNSNTVIKGSFMPMDAPNGFMLGYVFDPFICLFHPSSSGPGATNTIVWYVNGGNGVAYTANSLNDILGTEFEFEISDGSVKLNNTTASTMSMPTNTYAEFGIGSAMFQQFDYKKPIRWGYFQVYNGQTLVLDLVPAYNNGQYCFYDNVNGNYLYATGAVDGYIEPTTSISVSPEDAIVNSTGGTIEVTVNSSGSWVANPADGSWYSVSPTGGTTADTAVTITVPAYTGSTNRVDTIDFVDGSTTDEATFTLRQKKAQVGQPMYLGGDTIYEFYLGGHQISEMYIGETLVYSSGPFQGMKVTPKTINFSPSVLAATLKIKSSEAWTATTPAWVSASPSTGDTGETTVTLTATQQTADTTGNTVITSASYSASIVNNYKQINYVSYIHSQAEYADSPNYMLDTGIIPDTSTYGIVEGQFRGKRTPYCLVGYWTNDSNDWRFFKVVAEPGDNNNNSYMDVGNRRVNNVNVWLPTIGDNFEMEFGNLYIKNRLTDVTVTGTQYNGNLTGESIKLNTNPMWISRLRLYTQNNLVFDGKAAEVGGKYGLYDEVSETLFSSDNFTIVGETTN